MKKRKLSIITYGGWFNTFQRPHHLAAFLGKHYETCVINNVVRFPFRGYGYMAEQAKLVDRISNIYLLKEDERFPVLKGINGVLTKLQTYFKFRAREFGDSEIVYTWHVEDIGYLRHCRGKLLIYDAMDDWSAFSAKVDQRLIDNENKIVERADIVLAVSRKLYEKHVQLNKNTFLVPNGVDNDFFGEIPRYVKQESDALRRYRGKPVVGYVGGIHDWVDVDLIVETARLLPDVAFVLIGPALKSIKPKLEGIPNLNYLGPKPYSELISYMAYFSIGIIPFKLNLLNESTNPIKLYEYLGAGLPVVSTGMQEVVSHASPGIVYIANDPESFAGKILEAVATSDDPACMTERLRIAGQNSWASRAKLLLELIDAGVAPKLEEIRP